jgi:(1->4)-alpha-D-glucan 1-alpha-D-glucosylmutase
MAVNMTPSRVPLSTYRLQFSSHLRFEDARRLVGYLAKLGISDAYPSPLFRARQHSSHGYDVIDHSMIDPEIGDQRGFQLFAETLGQRGMGLMMDVVPNHMGIDDPHNLWWQDVLEYGPSATHAKYFDIDWDPPKETLKQKVLLPFLGDQYGRVLENQELKLIYDDNRFQITYYERRFPVAPRTWMPVLELTRDLVSATLPPEDEHLMELESIITALDNLPPQTEQDPDRIQHRYREKEVARRRLAALVEASPPIAQALNKTIDEFNGRKGDPQSFDRLEALLAVQPYRLCYWRVAVDEINYRRFFDINELAAIRVEDQEVFQAVHEMIFRYIRQGWVTGLRIDHPDGLLDPQQYFANLQESFREVMAEKAHEEGKTPPDQGLYVVVEKILGHDEALPELWPVCGTTGYDFMNLLNGLFVERRGAAALKEIFVRYTGMADTYATVLYESKQTILNVSMSSELHVLANQLDRVSEQHRWSRDFTRSTLRRALRGVISSFPVYRTYIRPGDEQVNEVDRRRIMAAVRLAKRRNPGVDASYFDFIASVLMLEEPDGLSEADRAERRQFVLKFQQVTGPVTAKGVEDTAFYRYYPLASLNEVGGEPASVGTTLESFHRNNVERQQQWPYTMSATGTHDTKRGEDVRARLNVISEIPEEWDLAIRRWRTLNEPVHPTHDEEPIPDVHEEYLLYQTLAGTWPLDRMDKPAHEEYVERIVRYMEKALKEAKLHTSWLSPEQEYDDRVAEFVRAILHDDRPDGFVEDLHHFVLAIADAGFVNSLSQVILKGCSPGVADFYQGTELWDFNLVDPDNRRPVDFQRRAEMLADLTQQAEIDLPGLARDLLDRWPDERLKMFVTWRTLAARGAHAELFRDGQYVPLEVEGPRSDNVCAFARQHNGRWLIAVTPRLCLEAVRQPVLAGAVQQQQEGFAEQDFPSSHAAARWTEEGGYADWWRDTSLRLPAGAPAQWRHVMTGETIELPGDGDGALRLAVESLFARFPVAMLESAAPE